MSINLTATNQSLEVVTTAAVQTQVVVSGRDRAASGQDTPVSQDANIVAAATTTAASAPAASTQRQVDDVEIIVIGSGQQGVTVQKNIGGTLRTVLIAALQTNERIHFTNDQGWRLFDAFGRERNGIVGYSLIKAPFFDGTAGAAKTYTPSIGCTALMVELYGAAGAGGGAANPTAAQCTLGSGGSCGGYVRKFFIGVPSSFLYTLGAGGVGVSGAAGNPGGATSCGPINGLTLVATAGPGGVILATGSSIVDSGVAAAVSGTGGDENLVRPSGAAGIRLSGVAGIGGEGGESEIGNNGARVCTNSTTAATGVNGNNASGNNAGGGGAVAFNAAGARAGGTGAPAAIRVWEFTG